MKWVNVGKSHWNMDRVQAFMWENGMLYVWWQGEMENPEKYSDPEAADYVRICLAAGVAPRKGALNGQG